MSSATHHGSSGQGADPRKTAQGDPFPIEPFSQSQASGVLHEMAEAWRDGRTIPAERWLELHPEFAADPQLAVRVVYEEICSREERGEQVASAEIFARFPRWKEHLEIVLDCHHLMPSENATAQFPEAPGRLGDLQLIRELGRGALGRVFLASQPSLSERLLVVKLTPASGREHLSLARLQHTHIAPLYLIQDFPAENLRALCMPYLGGASWSSLLERLRMIAPGDRTGRHIADMLLAEPREDEAAAPSGPALNFLARATYVDAVAWIGSCLADALHYAHQRGLVHLDVKPSNVLLAGDGQPMLLDFHLAYDSATAGRDAIERLGGTRGYMSPEQEATARAIGDGLTSGATFDGRSDIYSLGVLLYESLSGRLPPAGEHESRRTLVRLNADVSRGLSDVLHKCLARDPVDRYADAGQLAADLRRHLAALPLAGVPNRSPRERWQKWRRRKPHALLLLAVGLFAFAFTAVVATLFYGERTSEARRALTQARSALAGHDYALAVERLDAGRDAVRWFPGQYDLKHELKSQLAAAQRALVGAFHELVDRLRFIDAYQEVPLAKLRELEAGCRRIWQSRTQIATLADPSGAESESQLHAELLDLAVLWARLQMRVAAPGERDRARQSALEVLDEAERSWGPGLVLRLARVEIGGSSSGGGADLSDVAPAAKTVWEHYSLGRHLFGGGKLDAAQAEFDEAVRLEPNAFWPNFYSTLCAYRRDRFDDALRTAFVCVALAPTSAECFYNRALCHEALAHHGASRGDFTRALELDPAMSLAALHRGMVLAESGEHEQAIADFQTALKLGANPAAVHYQLALAHLAQHDSQQALASVEQSLRHDEAYEPAVQLKSELDKGR